MADIRVTWENEQDSNTEDLHTLVGSYRNSLHIDISLPRAQPCVRKIELTINPEM